MKTAPLLNRRSSRRLATPTTFIAALAAAVVFIGAAPRAARAADSRPNVVLIMTDDQGYGDVACLGNSVLATPNMDRLHDQSVRFTQFHVDPTCSPTRSALMTGRYSTRTGVWHTIAGRSLMCPDEVTMADVFAANGYRTGIFGKWHLGDNYPLRPQDRGFHETLVHGGGGVGQTPDFWGNDYFDDTYWHNGKPQKFTGYCTDVFFDGALAFIEQNKDKPFFCYIPTNAAHGPFNVADKYSKPYRDKGVKPNTANFFGMITNLDENLGRMMAKLDDWGLSDNTILIFMTDNGSAAGDFNANMRGMKGSPYEGGHRVPFFIRWPKAGIGGSANAARDVGVLSAHIDVLPTLIDMCNLNKQPGPTLDGVSLRAAMTGNVDGVLKARTLFVHSQRIEHPQKWRQSAVMTHRWRLVNGSELYDIIADPSQKTNVAADHADVLDQLRHAYDRWWDSLTPRFDGYCRFTIGSPHDNPTRITCHDWHSNAVPWNQAAVRRAPNANGFWMLNVARDGKYQFTLRQQPAEANFAIAADTARLKIQTVDATQPVPPGAAGVTFTVTLKQGPARLDTWLTTKTGNSRGAFYIDVKYLD